MTGNDGFGHLLLSEWTKLRSVNRWLITLIGVAALTVGLSVLTAAANSTDINEHPNFVVSPTGDPVEDTFVFVHQPLTGDGSLTVHVASVALVPHEREPTVNGVVPTIIGQTGPWSGAAAGIMVKDGTSPGSSYAAILLSPTNGVRLQSDFATDVAGSPANGSRWLRLVRSAGTVTGYESPDGSTWTKVGSVTPHSLPTTAEVGFYVSSTPSTLVVRSPGSTSSSDSPNEATATFDSVQLSNGSSAPWDAELVSSQPLDKGPKSIRPTGSMSQSGGTFTVTGAGKIGPQPPDDDMLSAALFGVLGGMMALIAIGALFATAEYRRGMIRTTFAASPRRGRVLAAKAIVIGAVAFVVGLIGEIVAVLAAQPYLRRNGFSPPAYHGIDLGDASILRALLLTAGVLALLAVFSLSLGALLRHSVAAITIGIVLVVLPVIVGIVLPGTPALVLMHTTLAGGLATQRAQPPNLTLAEPWAMIGPWTGFSVVAAYAAIALGLAWWRLRSTDA
jgi:hypothetical protein